MKAAIFDMDGTLINSLIFWKEFWNAVGEKYLGYSGFYPDEDTDRACRTLTLADAMALAHVRCGIGESGEALASLAAEMITTLYRDRVEAKPGVLAYLRHLKERGVKLAVCTATEGKLVRFAMDRCGLTEFFPLVVSCTAVGKGKEHPDVFLLALEKLGVRPEEAWMFEDSYVSLQTARSLGLHTVGIYDPNNYGQDILRSVSEHFIGEGEQLTRLIGAIE